MWILNLSALLVCVLGVTAAALLMNHQPAGIVFAALAALAGLAHTQMRCPRCGLHVASASARGFRSGIAPRTCPRCGRDRRGVRPFQHVTRPEPWDEGDPAQGRE